ncbi:MAG: hypothetical protein QNJ54_26580 [Prochloraceae cyanobacterium]|nr:hypothetical protein [Prochloraceae cyanobacterium]
MSQLKKNSTSIAPSSIERQKMADNRPFCSLYPIKSQAKKDITKIRIGQSTSLEVNNKTTSQKIR